MSTSSLLSLRRVLASVPRSPAFTSRTVACSRNTLRSLGAKPVSFDARPLIALRHHSSAAAYFNEAVGIDNEEADFIKAQSDPASKFRLSSKFVSKYADRRAPFGFNGLGEVVFHRSYARPLPDGTKEQWYQTIERVVNGTYNMQKQWIEHHQLGWNPWVAQKSAQEMFERIFTMKFLPPGRGLWAMGTPITDERHLYAALNNCAFVSTANLKEEGAKPFCFLFDASMLGVGVGFDTLGAGSIIIKNPSTPKPGSPDATFVIPDTRDGWVEALSIVVDAYFFGKLLPSFDFSKIRPAGTPVKGFGGLAGGPEPLQRLFKDMHNVLSPLIGKHITVTAIVDIMNMIGRCVISGNIRRTAEISFGDPNSKEYVELKDYSVNPHRAEYGWTSNNSVFAELGMNYGPICDKVVKNGEPGFAWLDNMRAYGRMCDPPNWKDERAMGGNPCLEQTLESYELCCLVETFPANHDSLEDYKRTLKFAYLYAKTVTLGRTHWSVTNRVMLRNRRIGCSISGIAQFLAKHGVNSLKEWCDEGYLAIQDYDKLYSDWLAIPRSIKTTSIKPSGTVSLLAGATPGMHYPESRFYIRRVRLSVHSDLLPALTAAGYHIEPDVVDSKASVVVSFPVDVGEGVRTVKNVPMWEQLSLAAFMQRYWADNQVSCTVTFDPKTEGPQLQHALETFQYQLKGVSFLPQQPQGAYAQMPYEEIDEATYKAMVAKLKPLSLKATQNEGPTSVPDAFCDAQGVCSVPPRTK